MSNANCSHDEDILHRHEMRRQERTIGRADFLHKSLQMKAVDIALEYPDKVIQLGRAIDEEGEAHEF